MTKYINLKGVSDPVHGLIQLDGLASELLATSAMQRLHGVHQLGLAYMVFPSAKYTRHAHSIGAYHNAKKLIQALKKNLSAKEFSSFASDEDVRMCEVIALMHDVGHFPFSHATEHVIKDHFSKNVVSAGIFSSNSEEKKKISLPTMAGINHEKMGMHIISHDSEVTRVLKRHGLNPDGVASCFDGNEPDFKLLGVISSDLDCDRLDYLRRTSHGSGAPYGSVDIDFLIEQATLDRDGNFCFKDKAARAADHLLVSRFYDYMQVPFNKTAVAIEWSLLECLKEAFKQGVIDPSADAMRNLVANGDWYNFDDQHVISIFRAMAKNSSNDHVLCDHLRAIQRREPAKLIASWDTLRFRRDTEISGEPKIVSDVSATYQSHVQIKELLTGLVAEIAEECSPDPKRLHVWDARVSFMKDGQELEDISQTEPEYYAEGVHIFETTSQLAARIGLRQDMLIGTLKHKYMSALRLYYLPESNERASFSDVAEKVSRKLVKKMPTPTWRAA